MKATATPNRQAQGVYSKAPLRENAGFLVGGRFDWEKKTPTEQWWLGHYKVWDPTQL